MNSIVVRGLLLGLVLLSGLPMRDGGAVFDLSKKGGGVRGGRQVLAMIFGRRVQINLHSGSNLPSGLGVGAGGMGGEIA